MVPDGTGMVPDGTSGLPDMAFDSASAQKPEQKSQPKQQWSLQPVVLHAHIVCTGQQFSCHHSCIYCLHSNYKLNSTNYSTNLQTPPGPNIDCIVRWYRDYRGLMQSFWGLGFMNRISEV